MNLLQPATAFLDRFNYITKFAVLGAFALVPIAFLFATAIPVLNRAVEDAGMEAEGVAYVGAAKQLLIAVQKHRGLSNAALSGDAQARDKLAGEAGNVAAALAAVKSLDARGGQTFLPGSPLDDIERQWRELAAANAGMAPAESFAAHTRVVGQTLRLITHFADASRLTLDPVLETYYLQDLIVTQVPPLMEALGKLRGKTAGILTRKAITPDEKVAVIGLTSEANVLLDRVLTDLDKVYAAAPGTKARLEERATALKAAIGQVKETTLREISETGFTLGGADYFKIASAPITEADKLVEMAAPQLHDLLVLRRDHERHILLLDIGFTVLMILAMAYLTLGLSASILHAVKGISAGATAMAGGDLTHAVALSARDEMGRIAGDLNRAREALAGLVGQTLRSAADLTETSVRVKDDTNRISQSSSQQNEAIAASASTVKALTVSVHQIAGQAAEADKQARQASELARHGLEVAETASRDMRAVAETVTRAASQIEGLNTRAGEITGIVHAIRDIADQTNLLALNAAIEAARAGEQGRGFAVVADEVRKLAERTGGATAEIATMIEAIQRDTHGAVEIMLSGSEKAKVGEQTVLDTAQALRDIQDAARNALNRVSDIASASREQTVSSQDIAQNMETIADMTAHNNSSVAQVSTSAAHLGHLAEALRSDLAKFRV